MNRAEPPHRGFALSKIHYAYPIMMLGLFSILGAQGFTRFGYTMLLPGMREEIGFSFAQMGLLATANSIGYSVISGLAGWFIARFGYRYCIGAGIVSVGVLMILTGISSSYELTLALQFFVGASGGLAIGPSAALATTWFSSRRRGVAAGITTAGGPLGSVITGPVLPLFMIAFGASGWRHAWCALGAIVLIIGVFDLVFLRNDPSEKGLAPAGATPSSADSRSGRSAGLTSAYRSWIVWHLGIISLFSTLGAMSFNTFFATYLIQDHAIDSSTVGLLWGITGVTGIVSGFIWGGVSDRFGRKTAMMGSFLVQTIVFALFAASGNVWIFGLCGFAYGLTARAAFTICAAYAGDLATGAVAAGVLGVTVFFAGVGQAISPTIAGWVADSTSTFVPVFWGSAGIAFLGVISSAFLQRVPLPETKATVPGSQ